MSTRGSERKGVNVKLIALCLLLTVASLGLSLRPQNVQADQITVRSLTLVAGPDDGGSKPGGLVNHLFNFTVPSGTSIGSIQFLYCTTAGGTCNTPGDLSTTSATLSSQNGATGFTMVNTTNGAPYLTRPAAVITGGTQLTYQLNTITNPSAANKSFYVRISTFASTDTTGLPTDQGTVAASTANQIVVSGTMPESLIFCTGATIGTTSGIPDCSTATLGAVNFNQQFSPTTTATATSQMAASTNAAGGYSITVNGPTLTSGLNSIPALTSSSGSIHGMGQFGLNLKANTSLTSPTPVGIEVTPGADGGQLKGQAAAGYNVIDSFKFNSGDSVANSADGGAGPTNAQIFTASYIANVPGSQPAGTYTSTLTYICTATF